MTKTYTVTGLMEWHLHLPTGFSDMPYIHIVFEGGMVSGFGVSPAKFTTDDPFIQRLIEDNHWYKSGRIRWEGNENRI